MRSVRRASYYTARRENRRRDEELEGRGQRIKTFSDDGPRERCAARFERFDLSPDRENDEARRLS